MRIRDHLARPARPSRAVPALSRLSLLIAAALLPAVAARSASFTDSITFSTTSQNLWGGNSAAVIDKSIFLGASWGTFTGGDASPAFSVGGIQNVTDPIFGSSLGSYGLKASMTSSAKIGLDFSTALRGGSLDYSKSINPVLSLPDILQANTAFTVSAIDRQNQAAVLTTIAPSISTFLSSTLDAKANLQATACFVSCSSLNQSFAFSTGSTNVISWDPAAIPQGRLGDGDFSTTLSSKEGRIVVLGTGSPKDVGSYKFADTFDASNCNTVSASFHCGANLFSGDFNLTAILSMAGKYFPFYQDLSAGPINFKGHILDVALKPNFSLNLDVAVSAPVFTQLQFDKPVYEILANGTSVLHSDGLVNFALGSSVNLKFGSQVGQLIKRSYYLKDASFDTSVNAAASLDLDAKVGCGVSLSAFGSNLVPDTSGNCLWSNYSTLGGNVGDIYNETNYMTAVTVTGTYQGVSGPPITEKNMSGEVATNQVLLISGPSSVGRVLNGATLKVANQGAVFKNDGGAKTYISGVVHVSGFGILVNDGGSELFIEPGGRLESDVGDGGTFMLNNGSVVGGNNVRSVITNRGTMAINGTLFNKGIINNKGVIQLTNAAPDGFGEIRMDVVGSELNNLAGGSMTADGTFYLAASAGFGGTANSPGTLNLHPGSSLTVLDGWVLPGVRQYSEGTVSGHVTIMGAQGQPAEFRVGNGSTQGALYARVTVMPYGTLSFNRSDDITFVNLIDGAGDVRKMGSGKLVLSGNNTYTGWTYIDGGRLVVQGLNASHEFQIAANAALELNAASGMRNIALDNRFTGAGTLIKTGNGTLVWGVGKGTFALSAGALIDIQGGTLLAGSSGNEDWTQNRSALNVAAGAIFAGVEGNIRVDALSGSGRISSGWVVNPDGIDYQGMRFGVANGDGVFTGVLADNDASQGFRGIFIKEGAGTQVLTGANTFTGRLTVNAGRLQIGDGGTTGSLATGLATVNGDLAFFRSDDTSFAAVIDGTGNLNKRGAGKLTLSGNNSYTGITSLQQGTLVLTGASSSRLFDIGQDTTLELNVASGVRDYASNTQVSGKGTLVKTGAGTARWTQTSALFAMDSGSLIDVQGGTLVGGSFGNEDWLRNKSRLNVAAGAIFDGVEANVRVDSLSGTGLIKSGFNGAGYAAFTFGVDNGSGDFSGVLSNADFPGNYVKEGTGTQILRGESTFTGNMTVAGGTLALVGSSSRLKNVSKIYVTNGATLNLGGISQSMVSLGEAGKGVVGNVGNGTVVATAGVFMQSGSLGATLIGEGTATLRRLWIGGDASATVLLYGTNDMVRSSDHQQVMIGSTTTGAAGTVKVGNANALAAATESVQVYSGTLDLNGVTGVRAASIALNSGAASSLLNNNVVGASFMGAIALNTPGARSLVGGAGLLTLGGAIGGHGGLDKVGAGTLVLTGTSTYDASTRVLAGEVKVNGSAAASAFSVALGTQLSGSGTVGTLGLRGNVAPGSSVGQLNVAGSSFWTSGASYLWEIANASGVAGVGYDLLNLGGSLDLEPTGANSFTIMLRSLLATGQAGAAAGFDPLHDHSYTLAYAAGGITGFSADAFSIDGSGFANPLNGGHWSIASSANALTLNFTAAVVPEPESYALLLAGLAVIGTVARRRLGAVARRC